MADPRPLGITCPVCRWRSVSALDIANGYCGNCHDFTFGFVSADPMLLPDDRIIDEMAIDIASHGERRIKLTMREREIATVYMLLHEGTRREVMHNLALPSLHSAEQLIATARAWLLVA